MIRKTPHLIRIAGALAALAFGSLAGASIPPVQTGLRC